MGFTPPVQHAACQYQVSSPVHREPGWRGRLPWTAWAWRAWPLIAVAALLASHWPGAAGLLEYQRAAVMDGQLWRLFTGHLVHFGSEHLGWDLAAYVVLAAALAERRPAELLLTLLLAPLVISAALWLAQPGLLTYRGLSGVDSALLAALALDLLVDAWRARRWSLLAGAGALVLGFAGKLGWECLTGGTLLVDHRAAGFTAVPLAHAAGAAVGLAVALAGRRR